MENTDQVTQKNTPSEFKNPEMFHVAPITAPGTFDDHYEDTEEVYQMLQDKFMATDVRDPELREMAKLCAEASRALIMANAALFGRHNGKPENKEKALAGFEKCKQDAQLREKNLKLHAKLTEGSTDLTAKENQKLWMDVIKSMIFALRTFNTQQHYIKLYVKDPDYMTPELAAEKRAGEQVAKLLKMVPKGHMFLPARPFPPARIPEDEEVPYPPAPFARWKNLPIEDRVYDEEHDEFVVPKGYVSKDGTIDDQSVVWNWEDRTVTMKFVNGEPVTWPFWKPRNAADVLQKGSWPADYYIRIYRRLLQDLEPPGMRNELPVKYKRT